MDLRRLSGSASHRRFGRRAGDAAVAMRCYAATFVAQVAGLSMPAKPPPRAYHIEELHPPKGLVMDRKA